MNGKPYTWQAAGRLGVPHDWFWSTALVKQRKRSRVKTALGVVALLSLYGLGHCYAEDPAQPSPTAIHGATVNSAQDHGFLIKTPLDIAAV